MQSFQNYFEHVAVLTKYKYWWRGGSSEVLKSFKFTGDSMSIATCQKLNSNVSLHSLLDKIRFKVVDT